MFEFEQLNQEDEDIIELKNKSIECRTRKLKWDKRVLISVIILIIVFIGFSLVYEIPLPYSPRVYVEPVDAVLLGNGKDAYWKELQDAIKDGDVPADYKDTYTQLRVGFEDLTGISTEQNLRTIQRDGKKIKIIYLSYSKTIFASLFMDSDFTDSITSGYSFARESGEKFDNTPEKLMTEVYYIKRTNLYKLDKLSDEEYDKLHENLEPIWCGKVDYLYR
ncbi:MAG: hypothetical protein ACTTH0_04940 [Eubacteriales bacterium]